MSTSKYVDSYLRSHNVTMAPLASAEPRGRTYGEITKPETILLAADIPELLGKLPTAVMATSPVLEAITQLPPQEGEQ